MSKPSRVIVLAEDRRHQNFALGTLKKAGYGLHEIYLCPLPAGRGAGEQFVRSNFPGQVQALRQRKARAETPLMVLVDADTRPTEQLRRMLAEELEGRRMDPVGPDERAGVLVPRRNIETWVVVLNGQTADESADYKSQVSDAELQPAGRAFLDGLRSATPGPANWLPSMLESAAEARKVLP